MNTEQLFKALEKSPKNKNVYFNQDKQFVFDLLESLIKNKEKYGYMACPCRLACGDRKKDKDIICPCEYRTLDVKEFGACFCGLYISKALKNKEIRSQYVPERRPVEKIF